MNVEKMKEFIRRLDAEGLTFQPSPNSLGTVSAENGMSVAIEDDGAVLYKPGNKSFAMRVMELYNQVQEYMSAFLNAPRQEIKRDGWQEDTRTLLLLYNRCELAAQRFSDNSIEFITWRLDKNGNRENGHYYNDFADAKRSFAIRAELINRDMLFTEKQLMVIRSNLSEYMASINTPITYSQEEAVKEVVRKIDNVIAPEIHEKAEEKEEEWENEPELEL